jgi:2-C-methyl-D-erythritol 4-phosphate cytidylyltransferase
VAEATPIRKFALIVAGGTGTRMGSGMPKQLMQINGRAILAHTIDRFLEFDGKLDIVIVLHESLAEAWPSFLDWNFSAETAPRLHVCLGGAERSESVHNGLAQIRKLAGDARVIVAIHDAVRPFVDQRMLSEGYALAEEKGNAVATVPVKSSMRKRTETGSIAVDRDDYFHVQTPQVFFLDDILAAYSRRPPTPTFTDDASLAEHFGMEIQMYFGGYDNLKITTPEDLIVAERLLLSRIH